MSVYPTSCKIDHEVGFLIDLMVIKIPSAPIYDESVKDNTTEDTTDERTETSL
jgi:hypothetical protein